MQSRRRWSGYVHTRTCAHRRTRAHAHTRLSNAANGLISYNDTYTHTHTHAHTNCPMKPSIAFQTEVNSALHTYSIHSYAYILFSNLFFSFSHISISFISFFLTERECSATNRACPDGYSCQCQTTTNNPSDPAPAARCVRDCTYTTAARNDIRVSSSNFWDMCQFIFDL